MRLSTQFCLAPFLGAAALLACSSEVVSNEAGPSNHDAGAPSSPITAQSACEHEFRVQFERCTKDVAPQTMTSARTRYVESCVSALGLAGSTRTVDEVEACAKAVEAEECGIVADILPACARKAGSLATGSACNVDAQCQSGLCDLLDAHAKGKGCGVCADTALEGEGCNSEGRACAPGTHCVGSKASPTVKTCQRVRYVDEKASCNGFDLQCRVGFMCASVKGAEPSCVRRLPAGERCSGNAMCVKEAFCSQNTGTCTNRGNAGDACDAMTPCADGLGCDRTTSKCGPLTFVGPDESCGGTVLCREGICGQGTGAPRCPQIIEDGEGCIEGAHTTCRAPAACIDGACVMPTTATCQ